jgi:putative endonuclease
VLVACEVKTRRGDGCGTPHQAVDPVRLERLHRLVWRWAEEHDVRPEEVRVDLVAVLRPRRGASIVDHVEGLA